MDIGSAVCVVAAVAAVAIIAWRGQRTAESNAVALSRVTEQLTALAHARPFALLERTEGGDVAAIMQEGRGEFPKNSPTIVHQHFAKAPPLEPAVDGLTDPMAEDADYSTVTQRRA
jgi:hypothetical protein